MMAAVGGYRNYLWLMCGCSSEGNELYLFFGEKQQSAEEEDSCEENLQRKKVGKMPTG